MGFHSTVFVFHFQSAKVEVTTKNTTDFHHVRLSTVYTAPEVEAHYDPNTGGEHKKLSLC